VSIFDVEDILWGVQDSLIANIATALAEEEAKRASRTPLTLPLPVNISKGYDALAWDLPSDQFPRVGVLATTRRPQFAGSGMEGFTDIRIEWIILWPMRTGVAFSVIKEECDLVNIRYAAAIAKIIHLKSNSFDGWEPEQLLNQWDNAQAVPMYRDPNNAFVVTHAAASGAHLLTLTGFATRSG
jgi:hypothetical protein